MSQWLCKETDEGVWCVGFYNAHGGWESVRDHADPKGAAAQVHYLNGGTNEPDDHGLGDMLTARPELMKCYVTKFFDRALQERGGRDDNLHPGILTRKFNERFKFINVPLLQ